MAKITDTAAKLAEPIAAANGCTLWDVEYLKEGGRMVLRVYIDREGGVSTDHLEAISRELEAKLDALDPIADGYTLELSSPGLERALKKPQHFAISAGKLVEVSLFKPIDGKKRFQGILKPIDAPGTITVGDVQIELKNAAGVKWVFEFNI
ncbi:ribosome maturation factor RimP [Clostridia bacterium]|nr:ribosome maturation factor RimP [Clostridia bacterium]